MEHSAVPSTTVSAPETVREKNVPVTVCPTVEHVEAVAAIEGISYADALSGTKRKLTAPTPESR